MEKKMDECLILLSKRGRAVVIIVVVRSTAPFIYVGFLCDCDE